MSKSKKELLVESFQKMDCNMLAVLLDESITYQDATKEMFLEKLTEAFSKFKRNSDTYLLPYKGFCNSEECFNKGCGGYSFVGNSSKNHIDLIFQESEGDICDIFHCNGFETNDQSIERMKLIYIDIKNDERADFKPSIDFLIKSQNCKFAYEELLQYQNTIIDKETYTFWLEKHFELFESFDSPPISYADFDKFHTLCSMFNKLNEFLQVSDLAKEGVEEFQTINKSGELHLLKWLTKYEKTGDCLTLFLYDQIDFENSEKRGYFEFNDFKISTLDFKYVAKFKFIFDEYYWDMLEKYTTFNDDDNIRYINEASDMSSYVSSLTYHLYKRGIII